jgi:hypothetical protein
MRIRRCKVERIFLLSTTQTTTEISFFDHAPHDGSIAAAAITSRVRQIGNLYDE